MSPAPKHTRRWYQFRVSDFLFFVTLLAVIWWQAVLRPATDEIRIAAGGGDRRSPGTMHFTWSPPIIVNRSPNDAEIFVRCAVASGVLLAFWSIAGVTLRAAPYSVDKTHVLPGGYPSVDLAEWVACPKLPRPTAAGSGSALDLSIYRPSYVAVA
jgi:hypothetical protein